MNLRSKLVPAAVVTGAAILLGLILMWRGPSAAVTPAPKTASPQPTAAAAGDGANPAHELKSLEAELKKKPDHVPILMRLAQLARDRGKPGEAVPYLRQAVAQEPGSLEARLELGRALYETGDVAAAIQETGVILERSPNHVDALYNLGAIHGNLGQDELARKYWNRAVASDPTSESGRKAKKSLEQLNAPMQPAAGSALTR